MEDPQRQPRGSDRSRIADRIRAVAAAGRIGTADRDIRLGNVASAQSMAELDLISRDLDLLEETLGTEAVPAAAAGPAAVAFPPGPAQPFTGAPAATGTGAKRVAVAFAAVLVLALVGVGGLAVFAFGGSSGSSGESSATGDPGLQAPDPFASEDPTADPEDDPIDDPAELTDSPVQTDAPKTPYALTGPGIRAYLAAYQARFKTSRVVDLTLYDDYAIVRVPIPGKNRHAGWLYRPGSGWTEFGGVSANFPGSAVVDTNKIAIPALLRNIAKARRTLNVEDYGTTYVNIDYRPQSDDGPNVNIYVSNEFHESGYLATTLDGRVERAYPFSP